MQRTIVQHSSAAEASDSLSKEGQYRKSGIKFNLDMLTAARSPLRRTMTNPFRRDKLSRTASETEERLDKTIANASDYDLTKQTVSKLHTMAE